MAKNKKDKKDPNVHDDLKGFDIKINEFGEIISNLDVDKVNTFLNENVEDKKLSDQDEDDNDTEQIEDKKD